jgi:histone acetyltransferase (RNA polymerase elongator complex component)
MKHINIPIFIPHLGCPNDCAFCNQRSISGKLSFDISSVRREIDTVLATVGEAMAEIAFFGGSFTGIDRDLMIELLENAEDYVKRGLVESIRLSTRPDYISREILDILKRYSVRHIELGIQSMDDSVLTASKRGHSANDSINACRLIKEYGFSLVGQMMIGLPGANGESEKMTARAICEMGAEAARIYPIVILKGTELVNMIKTGEYLPLSENELVDRSADVLEIFKENDVKVLRVGLHSGEGLNSGNDIACGYYHPAMGELVEGEIYYRRIKKLLQNAQNISSVTVTVPSGCLSKAIGQKGRNRQRLKGEFNLEKIDFAEDKSLNTITLKQH